MKALFFKKYLNLPMLVGILFMTDGLEDIFRTDYWLGGLTFALVGAVIYFVSDREPSETVASTPVPAPPPEPVCASLLPIEWDKAFDEPAETIPPTFFEALHKRDTRL